ncbi:MAG: guanylate kinase [Eubacterium sp.]|nr:guanylate kinase [Eubacterium sp.]
MGKLFVIMGKSATGKDSLYQKIVEDFPDLKEVVTYTTRPIRAGETYGKEYFFVTEEELHEMQEAGKIIECRQYQTVHGPWYYFTANDGQIDLSKGDYILITTLEGYCKLETFFGIRQVVPIYIEVDDFERIQRALKREKEQKTPCVAELCRRFLADEEDFSEEKLEETGIEIRVQNNDFREALGHIEDMIEENRA